MVRCEDPIDWSELVWDHEQKILTAERRVLIQAQQGLGLDLTVWPEIYSERLRNYHVKIRGKNKTILFERELIIKRGTRNYAYYTSADIPGVTVIIVW